MTGAQATGMCEFNNDKSDGTQHIKMLSKSARKKLAKRERLKELKLARRQRKKELSATRRREKKAERDARLQAMSKEDREKYFEAGRRAIQERTKAMRQRKEQGRYAMQNRATQRVCIDAEWAHLLTEKELVSLVRQISYSYSAIRNAAEDGREPLKLSIVGVSEELKKTLSSVAHGWETWPIRVADASLTDEFEANDMIYLTHDSENVLNTLDPSKVYIIGGMVDRNRLKGATKRKAGEMGIRCARFNLDETVVMNGTPVLTVNHCIHILSYVLNGLSWEDAYQKVLPMRKGLKKNIEKRKPAP